MSFRSWCSICVIVAFTLTMSSARRTPFGERPDECVLEVPHGSRVDDHPDGSAAVLVTLPDGSSYRHNSPASCAQQATARFTAGLGNNMSCNAMPCTCVSLPCNNWIDNAGSMNTQRLIGGMSAYYVTPGTPTKPNDNQTLFYFIGAENTDGYPRSGNPPPSGRAILQPVLTFDPSGWCNGSATGWCFASWYCCPKNLTVHSKYLQDVEPHDVFYGAFNLSTDRQTFTIISRSMRTKEETNLLCPRQERDFNWADVTQEVYGMNSCQDFAVGKMFFKNVALWDTNWTTMEPSWLLTSHKPCSGVIAQEGSEFYIEHSAD